jgi:uncharacterized membrane protein
MAGRGFTTALLLILIALACLAGMRRVERDRRFMARLRSARAFDPQSGLPLATLSQDDQDSAAGLAQAGVVAIERNRCYIVQSQLTMFRRKRTRVVLAGAFTAGLIAVLVAILILRR